VESSSRLEYYLKKKKEERKKKDIICMKQLLLRTNPSAIPINLSVSLKDQW
jgi:hypothetical protein